MAEINRTEIGPCVQLKLAGQLPSGKNQQQIIVVRGRVMKFPGKRFKAWRAESAYQLQNQIAGLPIFARPCVLRVRYWPGDLLRRDVSGQLDALFHLLEHVKLVKDDSLFQNVDWRRQELDRANPRVEFDIAEFVA